MAAPIVVRPSARLTPESPARPISSARVGRSRPCVISGITIVPPATTVTPAPSPKASTASSLDAATMTSGASTEPAIGLSSDRYDWDEGSYT